MRAVLWDRYDALFSRGWRVLDVGCGTGTDALYLAGKGIHVVGIDGSPGMIARARTKLSAARVAATVDFHQLGIDQLGSLPAGRFDGIISAFASLSVVPDLEQFSADAARLLHPQGSALLHLLNRWSLWEWLGLIRRGRLGAARRLGGDHRNFVIGERIVRHYLWRGAEAYRRFFAPQFRLRRVYGLGILRPPHTIRRVPSAVAGRLDALEPPLRGHRPFVDWGRFFVLELEKR